jgi:hypothetical protein
MSGSISKRMASDKTVPGEFGKHDILGDVGIPQPKQSDGGTLPQITRIGSWCIYDPKRFCQENRCSDCAVSENNK